jgi:hypothetical protein
MRQLLQLPAAAPNRHAACLQEMLMLLLLLLLPLPKVCLATSLTAPPPLLPDPPWCFFCSAPAGMWLLYCRCC